MHGLFGGGVVEKARESDSTIFHTFSRLRKQRTGICGKYFSTFIIISSWRRRRDML